MDEAILLRDDGLELCARVAQRREETGPPWAILAIWWFWVRAPGSLPLTRFGEWTIVDQCLSRCFSLFLVVSRCFSLFLVVSRCFSLFLVVSRCFSLFLVVS